MPLTESVNPRVADPDRTVETCLVCMVAWDTAFDPPKCNEAHHPHALNRYGDWDKVCHGKISDTPAMFSTERSSTPDGRVSVGVMLDRTAMALQAALDALREHVPNHHPARVGARKALDAWVAWSVATALSDGPQSD